MNEEKEDPILPAPEHDKNETIGDVPVMDTHHNGDALPGTIGSLNNEQDKSTVNYDQRRSNLLNNPNYGVILCFLDKFRAHVDIGDYPLHQLEENLLSDDETSKSHSFIVVFV
jgi:hypothetical protein